MTKEIDGKRVLTDQQQAEELIAALTGSYVTVVNQHHQPVPEAFAAALVHVHALFLSSLPAEIRKPIRKAMERELSKRLAGMLSQRGA